MRREELYLMPHLQRRLRVGVGQGGLTDITTTAAFQQNWAPVANQLSAEGVLAGSADYQFAQQSFIDAASQLYNSLGVPDANTALNAAQNYVLGAHTIAGAQQMIGTLINAAANGISAPQGVQLFTGTMVGVAVLAGAVSAGVGAAIVAGIGILAGLLGGGGSPGFQIPGCDTTFSSAPGYSVGCVGVFNLDPVASGPGSPLWKSFPSTADPNDAGWFDGSMLGWTGTQKPGGGWLGGGVPSVNVIPGQNRLIDVAFPQYHILECAIPAYGVAGFAHDFLAAFISAWKANAEYGLNGLQMQPDWQVLAHTVRVWNKAHEAGTPFAMAPAPMNTQVAPDCSDFTVGYEHMLVNGVVAGAKDQPPLYDTSGNIIVNTGALKSITATTTVTTGAPAPKTSTATKVALGTGAVVAVGAVSIGIVALMKGWAFGKAAEWVWGKTGGKVVTAVKRETRKLHR